MLKRDAGAASPFEIVHTQKCELVASRVTTNPFETRAHDGPIMRCENMHAIDVTLSSSIKTTN